MNIIVDGVTYRVNVIYPSHEVVAELLAGNNAGRAINQRQIRDIAATAYTHTMEIEPDDLYPGDFDALFWVLTAPVDSHRINLPFMQGTQEFDAAISTAKITDHNTQGEYRRWRGLAVNFTPIQPQRTE